MCECTYYISNRFRASVVYYFSMAFGFDFWFDFSRGNITIPANPKFSPPLSVFFHPLVRSYLIHHTPIALKSRRWFTKIKSDQRNSWKKQRNGATKKGEKPLSGFETPPFPIFSETTRVFVFFFYIFFFLVKIEKISSWPRSIALTSAHSNFTFIAYRD